jgi:hypothetical protein
MLIYAYLFVVYLLKASAGVSEKPYTYVLSYLKMTVLQSAFWR